MKVTKHSNSEYVIEEGSVRDNCIRGHLLSLGLGEVVLHGSDSHTPGESLVELLYQYFWNNRGWHALLCTQIIKHMVLNIQIEHLFAQLSHDVPVTCFSMRGALLLTQQNNAGIGV